MLPRILTVITCSLSLCACAHAAQDEVAITDQMPTAAAPRAPLGSAFQEHCRALHAAPIRTIGDLRSSYENLTDRYIEFKGKVEGVIISSGRRTCILEMDGSTVTLSIPDKLIDSSALAPGSAPDILATGDPVTTANEPPLLIVDATIRGGIVDAPPAETQTATVVSFGGNNANSSNNPMVVPPTGTVILPQEGSTQISPSSLPGYTPPRQYQPAPPTAGVAIDPSATIEQQKPLYVAMVRRFNPRLGVGQLDEIATALLRAGYENDMDPRFLASIISVESDFDINCHSSSGAMGLGQLMPFNVPEAGITDPWNPTQNILGTARLLRRHLNDYRDRPNGTLLAVAAYNAGPGAVRRAGYQVPDGAQVQHYVWKVYYRYRELAPDMFR